MNKKQRTARKKLFKSRKMIDEIKTVFSIAHFFECYRLKLTHKDMLRLVRRNKGKTANQILNDLYDVMISVN